MENKNVIQKELLVRGDLGDLFSVTDDFTGILHSVSDISGIPIFKIEDTGIATFTGAVVGIAPTADLNFATKKYVDDNAGGDDPNAWKITGSTIITDPIITGVPTFTSSATNAIFNLEYTGASTGYNFVFNSTSPTMDGSVTYKDNAGSVRSGIRMGNDTVTLGNRASNGIVQIAANDATAGSVGEFIVATFEDDNIAFLQPLDVTGNVTSIDPTLALHLATKQYVDKRRFIDIIEKSADYTTAGMDAESNILIEAKAGFTELTLDTTNLTEGFRGQVANNTGLDITITIAGTDSVMGSAGGPFTLANGYFAYYIKIGINLWALSIGAEGGSGGADPDAWKITGITTITTPTITGDATFNGTTTLSAGDSLNQLVLENPNNGTASYSIFRFNTGTSINEKYFLGYAPGHATLPNYLAIKNNVGNIGLFSNDSSNATLAIASANVGINKPIPVEALDVVGRIAVTLNPTTDAHVGNRGFNDARYDPIGSGGTGTVTSVTATAPLTGGAFTTSGTIGIPKASNTVDGYLSSGDWVTFNAKGVGTMSSFVLTADSGTDQSITNGQTVNIAGGSGVATVVGATDKITVSLGSLTQAWSAGAFDITANDFVSTSDARLKHDIVPIDESDIFRKFKLNSHKDQVRFGVIAQEIVEKYPEVVHTDEEGIMSVSYIDLLVKRNAEKDKKIKELEERLERIELIILDMM